MENFELSIDLKKFRSTNGAWNALGLNSPHRIGYVSRLIFDRKFSDKEEWKIYYYQSGEKRLKQIAQLPLEKQVAIRDCNASLLSKEEKKLLYEYGRTQQEINLLGRLLYEEVCKQGNPENLTLHECRYCAHYRVVGETWNGIILQEYNTVETLKKQFPMFEITKTTEVEDMKYEVDYELFLGGALICGIQIKPMSYVNSKLQGVEAVREINLRKNQLYEREKKAKVIYVYSNTKGEIQHAESINEIALLQEMLLRVKAN